ncbi:MAG: thioredoxin [Pseudomonadota bacterium]
MATVTVNNDNFQSDVLGAETPVVVDFWAEWCGPCKMIAPALEELSGEFDGKVKIAKINIDENPDIAAQYGVRSIPTLYMFKDGEVVDQMVGAAPKGKLSDWMKNSVS